MLRWGKEKLRIFQNGFGVDFHRDCFAVGEGTVTALGGGGRGGLLVAAGGCVEMRLWLKSPVRTGEENERRFIGRDSREEGGGVWSEMGFSFPGFRCCYVDPAVLNLSIMEGVAV